MFGVSDTIDILAILLLAGMGVYFGRLFSRVKSSHWAWGYAIPMLGVAAFILGNRFVPLAFVPPISFLMRGRNQYFIMAPVVTMIFTLLIPRLRTLREKIMVGVLAGCFSLVYSVLPIVAPVASRPTLAALKTTFDSQGVCRQTTDYTCGPAAAVSALRQVGIKAEEGDMAIRAHCSRIGGTTNDCLRLAILDAYATDGVRAVYRPYPSIAALPRKGPTIVITKFSFLTDHFLTVLSVTPTHLVVADPAEGLRELSYEQFSRIWRYSGIAVSRDHGIAAGPD